MESIGEFFAALNGPDVSGHLIIWANPSKRTYSMPALAYENIQRRASSLSGTEDVYFGVGIQGSKPQGSGRGTEEGVRSISFLWADIDVAGPNHAGSQYPPDVTAAVSLAYEYPCPPTLIVASGGGIHAYWAFDAPWVFATKDERRMARVMTDRFQETLRVKAAAHGWGMDATSDLARVLRVPFTLNHKSAPPTNVRVIEYHAERRYARGDLASHFTTAVAPPKCSRKVTNAAGAIPAGSRHSTLVSVAGTMAKRGLPVSAIRSALRVTNAERCEPPMARGEVDRIASDAGKWIGSDLSTGPSAELPAGMITERKEYERNDTGNAKRLVDAFGNDIRYAHDSGKWYIWNGMIWEPDRTSQMTLRGISVVETMQREAQSGNHEPDKRLAGFAVRSANEHGLKAMVSLAEKLGDVPLLASAFDRSDNLIVCANGVIEADPGAKRVLFREHRKPDMCSRTTHIAYDPEARSAIWDELLERLTPETREFLRRAMGLSLIRRVGKRFFFVVGSPDSGKSTIMTACSRAMGDYASETQPQTVCARRERGGPEPELAKLEAARVTFIPEVTDKMRFDEGRLKNWTGMVNITARDLHKGERSFRPPVLWMDGNSKPFFDPTETGLCSRLNLVVIDKTIPLAERDDAKSDALKDPSVSGAAILAWMVGGLQASLQDGLVLPGESLDEMEAYKVDIDVLHDFWSECTNEADDQTETVAGVRKILLAWLTARGEKPVSSRQFNKQAEGRGHKRATDGCVRCWKGFSILVSATTKYGGYEQDRIGRRERE